MTVALGTSSCSNSSRFGATSTFNWVTPVTLPPGRSSLLTRPSLNRVEADLKDDWNGLGRCLGR